MSYGERTTLTVIKSICSNIKCCKSRSLQLKPVHGENDHPMHLVTILMAAVLANNSPSGSTYIKSPWLVVCDFNQCTAILYLNILMAGSLIIIFMCISPLA